MAGQTLTVVGLTADNVEDVLAVSPFPEQLQYVNPVAWYVARSAYQDVWQPVGLATEDGVVVGFAEWAYDESDGTYSLGGITIDHRQQGRGLGRAALDALVAHHSGTASARCRSAHRARGQRASARTLRALRVRCDG